MSMSCRKEIWRNLLGGLAIWLASLVMVALLSSPLAAQGNYGSIVGLVSDSSGAVIPGASVTLTNMGTNEKRTFETDSAGNYRFVSLLPASYKLEVEKSGFKRLERDSIAVQVGNQLRIDVAMEIGVVTEVVEVSAQTPLLNTESASLSQVVEGQQVQQMPLNGRNVVNLIAMTPGVVPQGSSMGGSSLNQADHTNNQGWGNYQIGGGLSQSNAMYIDGAPINVLAGNVIGLVITQDAVQEFNVSTNSSSAEFGRTGGGVVNMATKSGNNSFHGSAYEYFRNNVLNANAWDTNLNGVARPQWNQNQYGATISGPLIKDKLFFFFSWEGFKSREGVTASTYMPTAAEHNGWVNATLSTSTLASYGISSSCVSYAGSKTKIDSSCISPTAKWYLNNYFNTGSDTVVGGMNYYSTPVVGDDANQYTGRADYNISDKQRLFGRYTYWAMTGRYEDRANRILSADNSSKTRTQQFVLGDTYTFTPTTILDVRLFYFRNYFDDNPSSLGYDVSTISSGLSQYMSGMTFTMVPAIGFSNTALSYFSGQRGGTTTTQTNTYGFSASISKMKGSHNLKFGNEFRLMDKNYTGVSNPSGRWTFNSSSPLTGNYWSDFLFGLPTSVSVGSGAPITNYNYYQGYYVTDTWQVNRKLTLNLGLRWELPGSIAEKHDRLTVLLPSAVDPLTGAIGTIAMVNSSLYSERASTESKHNLFAPRVGMAYRVTANTVLRAGYGLSFLPPDMGSGLGGDSSVINAASNSWDNTKTYTGCTWVYATMANPFPAEACSSYAGGVPISAGRSNTSYMKNYYNNTTQAISGAYPYVPYPYVQQWNLALGHQFGDTMVELGYAGSRGTHLPMNGVNLNEISSAYWSAANAYVATHTSSATKTYFQQYRPYPYYGNVNILDYYNGNSFYHSMQAKVQKRFKNGGLLMANYTWSKNIGTADSQNGSLDTKPGAGATSGVVQQAYTDYNNLAGEKSLSAYDVPHRLTVSYVLDLPFGQGKKFGAGYKGVASKLISGWSINGITTFQSGFPLIFTSNTGLSDLGGGTGRPNVIAGCDSAISGSAETKLSQWFNTACFQALSTANGNYYSVGTESRVDPKLRSQGINNWDLSILKTTKIKEKVNMDFRAEAFNVFNRVRFRPPDCNASSSSFGETYLQSNLPRLIQFSLRFSF